MGRRKDEDAAARGEGRGGLTHLDAEGRVRMVDVSEKPATVRRARARAIVRMAPETADAIREARVAKGDVLAVARIAGVQGAKRTAELVPLCHPLPLDHVEVSVEVEEARVVVHATCTTTGRTGVEMEALTACTVAALTVYDMAKALDRDMSIAEVVLLEKHGGRSGSWVREARVDE